MASPTAHKLAVPSPLFPPPSTSSSRRRRHSSQSLSSRSKLFDSTVCRCQSSSPSPSDSSSSSSSPPLWSWESSLGDAVKIAAQCFDKLFRSTIPRPRAGADSPPIADAEPDWSWDRWCRHFCEVEDEEKLVSALKSQLEEMIRSERYGDAARLKAAIAAASPNDVVGRAIHKLNKAVEEERYRDAAYIRDNSGVGLVGWWHGVTYEHGHTSGQIIRVTKEYGRYLATSYSPGDLSSGGAGEPLFEIFLTENKKGQYKQQAVYLKRERPSVSFMASCLESNFYPLDPADDLLVTVIEDAADEDIDKDDVADPAKESSAFNKALKDANPGAKIRVYKVMAPGKIDKNLIAKVIDQILEDDEEKDDDIGNLDGDMDKSYQDIDLIESNANPEVAECKEQSKISHKLFDCDYDYMLGKQAKYKLRVPAKLNRDGRSSFSLSVDDKNQISLFTESKLLGRPSFDDVVLDLTKFIGGKKIPLNLKVLKDVRDSISLNLGWFHSCHPPLSGSTTFNRIESPASSDVLNGLYIGSQGRNTSEIIHLQRKFGQWKDDSGATETSDLQFYEYVEGQKITGDSCLPAGQITFRAKVGKRYQLPVKGLVLEEIGVIARYQGQGRRSHGPWMDGELIILDGKNGPDVGFLFRAPEFQSVVLYDRLKLQE